MITNFPQQRQQTGWSCLPTAVLCVLGYLGAGDVSMDQVAVWCRIGPGGACLWDNTIAGLRDALGTEFDVEVLEGDWDGIREAVEENDEPVIVTIANPSPLADLVGDHAVVIFQIGHFGGHSERVVYMDPEGGGYETKQTDEFLLWWDTPGERAFLLRP